MSINFKDYNKVWHVSVQGDDINGDGSPLFPFASVKRALEFAYDGDGIFIHEGVYRLAPMELTHTTLSAEAGIYCRRNIHIWGENDKTILEWYGEDSKADYASPLCVINSDAIISNLKIHFYPGKDEIIEGRYNSIFFMSKGIFKNLFIENKGEKRWSFTYDHGNGSPKIYNSIFKSNGLFFTRSSSNDLFVNCLFDSNLPARGTKRFCISRNIIESDWNPNIPITSDLKDAGDPSILDPDGSISDIGVKGGPLGWINPESNEIECLIQIPERNNLFSSLDISSPYIKDRIDTSINLLKYNKIIYVDAKIGDDQNGDGNYNNPVATISRAIELVNENNNEAILINEGIYDLNYFSSLFDKKGIDFIGVPLKTIVRISGVNSSFSSDVISNLYNITFIPHNNSTLGNYFVNSGSVTYNLGIYNCVFDSKNMISNYFLIFQSGSITEFTIEKLEIYNSIFIGNNRIPISMVGYLLTENRAEFINIATTFNDIGTNNRFRVITSLTNAQFDEEYNIISSDWQHTGTGENPDGTQANIGVYGGKYAWGKWVVYAHHQKAHIQISHRSDFSASIMVKPYGWMEGTFRIYPVYFDYFTSYIEIKKVSQIISNISIPPHNSMSGIFDIVPPPKVNLKLTPIKDAFVREGVPKLNYGVEEQIAVGTEYNGKLLRSFIQFDLSSIPENQKLTKAALCLYYDQSDAPILDVEIYNVTEEWDEYGVTWVGQPKIGDKVTDFQVGETRGYIRIDILPLVKKWYKGDIDNFGLMLKSRDENIMLHKLFYSKESRQGSAPMLDVEYYDPVIKSIGRTEIPSFGITRQNKNSDLESSLFIKSTWDNYDFPAKIHIFNPDMLESELIVIRANMYSTLQVRREEEEFLLTELKVRQNMSGDIEGKIIVSSPVFYSTITIRVKDEDDFVAYISVSREETDEISGGILVSRNFINSKIEVVYSSVIEGNIKVIREQIDDINSIIAVRQEDFKEILGNIEIWHKSILQSNIQVRSGYFRSNIIIPYRDHSDMLGRIRTRIRYASDLPASIGVHYNSEIICFIFVDEEREDYQYVFII